MARYPKAKWDPISGSAGPYTGGPWKIVHHKTQGASLAGARSAYRAARSDPHFTVHAGGVNQHIDTNTAARSLRNAAGGVQTNRDQAIQIETVGFSSVDGDDATLNHLCDLIRWIQAIHGIDWAWPEGRPPLDSATGYGERTAERHAGVWDTQGGHYGHSQVPENDHWDPGYTDREWWILNAKCQTSPPTTQEASKMLNKPATAVVVTPSGAGYWIVAEDGGVFAYGDAPFLGSLGDLVLNAPIVDADCTPSGKGLFLLGADGGIFAFGDAPFLGSAA